MTWTIPMYWDMQGFAQVEAQSLNEAIEKADQSFSPTEQDVVEGSYMVDDRYTVEEIRRLFNDGRLDRDYDAYPELERYNEDGVCDMFRLRKKLKEGEGIYVFRFRVDGQMYVCRLCATGQLDAIGRFVVNHQHIPFDNVVEFAPGEIEAQQ